MLLYGLKRKDRLCKKKFIKPKSSTFAVAFHLGVKPRNMLFMVTSDGTRVLKMIDFGGTELKENHSKNPTNSAEEIKCMHQKVEFGTGPYLAPEQLQTFVLVFLWLNISF